MDTNVLEENVASICLIDMSELSMWPGIKGRNGWWALTGEEAEPYEDPNHSSNTLAVKFQI
jgi:hypothetical protein